ncbi:unnamed protein product, partial [Meganyctiphanes norvegica]
LVEAILRHAHKYIGEMEEAMDTTLGRLVHPQPQPLEPLQHLQQNSASAAHSVQQNLLVSFTPASPVRHTLVSLVHISRLFHQRRTLSWRLSRLMHKHSVLNGCDSYINYTSAAL